MTLAHSLQPYPTSENTLLPNLKNRAVSGTFQPEATSDQELLGGIFQMLKEQNCQPRIPSSAKLSFKNTEEAFPKWKELKEFTITRNISQEMLKDILQAKMKRMLINMVKKKKNIWLCKAHC